MVLQQMFFISQAKPEDTLDLSQILNNHLADLVKENPTRFVALGTLPMQAPDLAVKELIRCRKELGTFLSMNLRYIYNLMFTYFLSDYNYSSIMCMLMGLF